MNLQILKAPWVDECYTFYGIRQDNLCEFYSSILTGINFSPPLYFFFNFCIQLILPTSIELLRIQSLIWSLVGLFLAFLFARKMLGSLPALLSTIIVASQSDSLLSQAQEARHYTMLFACSTWVVYVLSCNPNKEHSLKVKMLIFSSHLCLCQIHYLGIIFSGMVGFAYILSYREKSWFKRIPNPITLSWLLSIPIYLFLLSNQSSHLGNWPKPNRLTDILANYNDVVYILSIIGPIAGILLLRMHKNKKLSAEFKKPPDEIRVIILTFVRCL